MSKKPLISELEMGIYMKKKREDIKDEISANKKTEGAETDTVEAEVLEEAGDTGNKPPLTEEEKRKRKKRRNMINILSVCLIVIGIGVIAYPIGTGLYAKYWQEQMKKEFYRLLELNSTEPEPVEVQQDLNLEDDTTLNVGIDVDAILEADEAETSGEKNPQADKDETDVTNAQVVEDQLGGQNIIGLITIESIGIEYVIVEGTDAANINAAVGHIKTTKALGQKGNCAIAGHRGGRYGEFFQNLNLVKEGARIVVKDLNGNVYTYKAYEIKTIKPNETEVIEDIKDETTLTLISCENHGTKRIIVHAKLESQMKE